MKKIPTPVETTRNGERGCRSNLATDASAGATAAGTTRSDDAEVDRPNIDTSTSDSIWPTAE